MAEPDIGLDFSAWVSAHVPILHRAAAFYVARSDRDDLVQETLVRAWDRRADFDQNRGSARAWLCAILADRARRNWRRAHPGLIFDLGLIAEHTSESATHANLDVRRAISGLPPRQRDAVLWHYYVDLTVEDTATVLSCSLGTIKSNLFEARRRLQQELSDYAH